VGRQENYDEYNDEYTPMDKPSLRKMHVCMRAFDDDIALVKEKTDDLMDNDKDELGGKLTVIDDLVEQDDGQYLPPGEGQPQAVSPSQPYTPSPITIINPKDHTRITLFPPKYWEEMKAKIKAKAENDKSKANP
jgi:hypothetical protein